MKDCDICLASKIVYHKLFEDLQTLQILTHCWKDLSMDFIIGLFMSTNYKSDNYDLILIIVDFLTKIVHYKLVKVIINFLHFADIIIDILMRRHSLFDSIISD